MVYLLDLEGGDCVSLLWLDNLCSWLRGTLLVPRCRVLGNVGLELETLSHPVSIVPRHPGPVSQSIVPQARVLSSPTHTTAL